MSELDQVVKDPEKLKEYLDGKSAIDTNIAVIPQNPFLFPQMPDPKTTTYVPSQKEGDLQPVNLSPEDKKLAFPYFTNNLLVKTGAGILESPTLADMIAYRTKQDDGDEEGGAGFWRSAWLQFRETSSVANVAETLGRKAFEPGENDDLGLGLVGRGIKYAYNKFMETPSDWNPKMDMPKYVGVNDENIGFLLNSKNPQDMAYRYNWIQDQQKREEELKSGKNLGKLLGFGIGISPFGSPETLLIPEIAAAKYAKVAPEFFTGIAKSFPGMLGVSAIHEGAAQMNKTSGNLVDFLTNTFIDGAVGGLFYGTTRAVGTMIDGSVLKQLKNYAKAKLVDDIDFGFKLNDEAKVIGIDAIDNTGSVGAKGMKLYQEMADSAFYKGGLFKIPYIGTGVYAVLTGNLPGMKYMLGSPLPRLAASSYKSANQFMDRIFDHFFTTTNTMKGGVKPRDYTTQMQQMRGEITQMGWTLRGAYVERLGYETFPTKPLLGIQNLGLQTQQKAYEKLLSESNASNFISHEDFMDEIQQVMTSGDASSHSVVNEMASQFSQFYDKIYKGYQDSDPKGPINWLGSQHLRRYLTRVYDTPYMSTGVGKNTWESVIPAELKKQDQEILQRTQPIRDLEARIKDFETQHSAAVYELGLLGLRDDSGEVAERGLAQVTKEVGKPLRTMESKAVGRLAQPLLEAPKHVGMSTPAMELRSLRLRLNSMKNALQNELRDDPKWHYHVDDHSALSFDEAKELTNTLKPLNEAKAKVKDQENIIKDLKIQRGKALSSAKRSGTKEVAQPHAEKYVEDDLEIQNAEKELLMLRDQEFLADDELQQMAHNKQLDRRFYRKNMESGQYEFQDPANRLKFRDVYESDAHRLEAARAYSDSILNMHPEDIISDMMGKLTGNKSANVLKSRTLNIPDNVLYDAGFMTKDLMAKTANYANYLGRLTHFNNAFHGIAYEDGFEALSKGLLEEFNDRRGIYDKEIKALLTKKEAVKGDKKETKKIDKLIAQNEKPIKKATKEFNQAKDDMKHVYENRIMGYNKRDQYVNWQKSLYMNVVSQYNLHNLAFTMTTDTSAIASMFGMWPLVKDGLFPALQSMLGSLKTKGSEAFREAAPHIHLGLQDVVGGMTARNFGNNTMPYLNMGRVVEGVEKISQLSANLDLGTYVENINQRAAASTIQSEFMKFLHQYLDGTLSEKNSLKLRKYGIDPQKWAKRMVDSYKQADGSKDKLGGYNSKFWKWQDLEASNEFGDAVFRGVKNTVINTGLGDKPFWADDAVGMVFHTFGGWAYAFTNRFIIPKMQHPDAKAILEMTWMLGAGAMQGPLRRVSRGEEAWPEDMTDTQFMMEAFYDSGLIGKLEPFLQTANMLSGDRLLGNLKNDKYRQRMRVGMGSVGESTWSALADVISMTASNEVNQTDLKKAAKFFPLLYAPYMRKLTDKYIENTSFPRTREQARRLKEFN